MDLDLTPIPERSIQDARPPFVTPTTRFTRYLTRSSQGNESFGMNDTKEQWFTPTNDFTPQAMVLRSQCGKVSQEKMAEFQIENDKLQEEIKSLNEKVEALQKQKCATEDENSHLKSILSNLRTESAIVEERLKKKNEDFDNLTKEVLSLQAEVKNFKKKPKVVVSPNNQTPVSLGPEKNVAQFNLNRKKSFIARPVPNFDKVARLPPANKKKSTETKPFNVYNRPTQASINKSITPK